MSLLMDALKQAEHAKRGNKQEKQTPSTPTAVAPVPDTDKPIDEAAVAESSAGGRGPAQSGGELSLTPVEPPQVEPLEAAEKFDDAPREINPEQIKPEQIKPEQIKTAQNKSEQVDEEPVKAAPTASPTTAKATPAVARPAAPEPPSTTESSSTPESAPTQPALATSNRPVSNSAQVAARVLAASEARIAAQRKHKRYALVGLVVLTLFAMVGYYYWANLTYNPSPLHIPDLPDTLAADGSTPDTPALQATPESMPETAAPAQTPWRVGAAPEQDSTDWEGAPVDARAVRGEQPEPFSAEPAVAAEPRASIRITRSTRSNRISDALQTAYLDYQAGRYAQATDGYRQVLAAEPGNRDARLGLAALAMQRGETETARSLYQELLRLDPKDSSAQAALASLQQEPSAETESELKLLLAEQPNAAQLHFALANLYAAQARWPQAQQAYFDAQRLRPTHPDYAFNLAISLEHLGQPQAALEYYRRALALATRQPANFAVAAAEQRVQALEGQPRP